MSAPFISEQDLVSYIGVGSVADPGIAIAVDAACAVCRTIAEQSFDAVVGDVIYRDGTGTDVLVLPELPATHAGTVLVNGSAITDYTLSTETGMLFRGTVNPSSSSWLEDPEWVSPLVWPRGRQNIKVTYDHGFAGTVPSDVRMVALSAAARFVIQGAAIAETQGDLSVRYAGAATDLTVGERAILRKYRR